MCAQPRLGFGKTYTCLSALCWILLKYNDTHAICLIPQKAVKAFKRELEEKLRVSYNLFTSNSNKTMPNARITLITHTSLKKYTEYIKDLSKDHRLLLLVDESHVLQQNDSKTYTLVASIRHYFNLCWFATATPLKIIFKVYIG